MKINQAVKGLLLIIILTISSNIQAQEALKTRLSPLEVVTLKYEDTYVKITYGRPHKKGREIFGGLVPFGKVWRTGANEATEITVSAKIKLGEHELEAGTYSIFTIPNTEEWIFILNSELGQWGSYKYLEEFDIARFKVPTKTLSVEYEPFTIEFEQFKDNFSLVLKWDKTKIEIPIIFL